MATENTARFTNSSSFIQKTVIKTKTETKINRETKILLADYARPLCVAANSGMSAL